MNPIQGKRILVTRPSSQSGDLLVQLAERGAVGLPFPVIRIEPIEDYAVLDLAIWQLESYAWVIFTSANGVRAFWQRLAESVFEGKFPRGPRVAAIGPVTAQALEERGVKPDFMPAKYIAEEIVAGLGSVSGQRILLPRAEIAREALVEELSQGGAQPEEIPVYHTIQNQPDEAMLAELKRGVDAVTFTSSSTVRCFHQILAEQALELRPGTAVACIGPITALTAVEYGYKVDLVADTFTGAGLVQALERYYSQKEQERTA
jgi:uroporphyrinogen III methyltransferase / synthase